MKRIRNYLRSNRYIITIFLAVVAICIECFYSICGISCSYLKGEIFGIQQLEYIGIIYMVVIIILAILKKNEYLLILLSAGLGSEIYLVGFQFWHHIYCLYCLAFAVIVIVQFILNCDKKKRMTILLSMVISFVLFFIFFKGTTTLQYPFDSETSPSLDLIMSKYLV